MKENYEAKKQEKQRQKKKQRFEAGRQRFLRKARTYVVVVVILAAVAFGLYFLVTSLSPQGEDFSRAVPVMDNISHIPEGQSEFTEYNSNPPTSGPHYGQTAISGFREAEIPDGHIIHNLEHGDIWISYHPSIPDHIKEELRQFGAAKVIITPRKANDTDIALAAWGRLDTFDIEEDLPVERIRDFIKRYTGRGPERVSGASGGI